MPKKLRGFDEIRAYLGLPSIASVRTLVSLDEFAHFREGAKTCTTTAILDAWRISQEQSAVQAHAARAAARAAEA